MKTDHPPKDGLVRAAPQSLEVRAATDGTMPKLFGYMMRFNEWTEIDSIFEGRFMERIAPGAATKTLRENTGIRILFNHGRDPSVGMKPLAEPKLLEDKEGLRYDDPELFDTAYCRDLIPGLERGQYGSSFKFRSVKETFDAEPGKSSDNPEGIPERTIEELQLFEGGPVTFPAYAGATAGARCRSLTDHYFIEALKDDPTRAHELDELFTRWVALDPERVAQLLEEAEQRVAIAYRKTATSNAAWDGPKVEASMPNDCKASELRQMYAWIDPAKDASTKAAYRFIHHEWTDGKPGAANLAACSFGIGVLNGARGGTTIPDSDRQGVYDHLARHLKDAGQTPPELKSRSELDEPNGSEGSSTVDAALHGAEGTHSGGSRAKAPLYGVTDESKAPDWRL